MAIDPDCSCNIAAMFPEVGGLGIISATLKANTDIIITNDEPPMILYGPSIGSLSVTAYAPLDETDILTCPARAGVSYDWVRKYDCDEDEIYFISRGKDKAFREGPVTADITLTEVLEYGSWSASATGGPTTVYLMSTHFDGYEFSYTGGPFPIADRTATTSIFDNILPIDSKLYLNNFSWEYTPPKIPMVSYSFIFVYNGESII